MIYSVVDNWKFAHLNSSKALVSILWRRGIGIRYHHEDKHNAYKLFYLLKRNDTVIIWNIGVCFFLAPLFRLLGARVIYTFHEPASLMERIGKVGFSFHIVFTHVAILLYTPLFSKAIALNESKARKFDLPYAPLPFTQAFTQGSSVENESLVLIFIGGKLESRKLALFNDMVRSQRFTDNGWQYTFFPSKNLYLEEDKCRLLSKRKSVIWNVFNVAYNQSGITLDALKYGVPIVVSEFEQLGRDSVEDPFVRLPSNCNSIDEAIDILDLIDKNYGEYMNAIRKFCCKEYSEELIFEHWHRILLHH